MNNETRKLMKLLHLETDEIYHVFCLAICMAMMDGKVTDEEGEILTRIGFGLGLTPQDISALGKNAKAAISETSPTDVIAFSIASLKTRLESEQLAGIKMILHFVAKSDSHVDPKEQALLKLLEEMWPDDEEVVSGK